MDHHNMTESIRNRPEIQNMKNDIDSLKTNGSELMRGIKQESADMVREELSRLKKTGMDKVHHVEDQVRSRPGQSIAVGLAAGLAISYFLARRR